MAHYTVYSPFQTGKRFLSRYTDPDKNEQARAFATLIEGMGKSLDDIMNRLEKLGVAESTLVLFLGDNGGDAPLGDERDYGSSAPLRGKKGIELEGGMRAPFIIAWARPGKKSKIRENLPIEVGSMQTQLDAIIDIYPTVLPVTGCEVPQNYMINGFDLRKQLSGKMDEKRPEPFLIYFPHAHRGNYFTTHHMGDQKLIYCYLPETSKQPKTLLYNLRDDPEERNELSATRPDQYRGMIRGMSARLEKEGAPYPVDKQGDELKPSIYF